MANLRQTLYAWRDNEAAKRGMELFRILPNTALDEIVKALPRTKEELTAIKGIKDAKYQSYGKQILAMVDEHVGTSKKEEGDSKKVNSEELQKTNNSQELPLKSQEEQVFSVGSYLDIVNNSLWRLSARVRGEITSLKFQGSALYLGIKDSEDNSMMNVFMWNSDYEMSGIEVAEGMEVIVAGKSEIYKPSGRFSFRAETIELVGEGALKKSYDMLKKKLDAEGIFALKRKRSLPDFPEHLGLITSKQGAVIHDFLNNLGKFGYRVRFVDARVEGITAVKDLLAAIAYFTTQPIDCLVLVRGGGSLESLQAFNNELVVRAIAEFPKPVICAIGHDKDVPLAQLAADFAPSTPTACTALLNDPWERAVADVRLMERDMFGAMNERLWFIRTELRDTQTALATRFRTLLALFQKSVQAVNVYVPLLENALVRARKESDETLRLLIMRYHAGLNIFEETIKRMALSLAAYDPLRQLKLGYSLLSRQGKVLRSVARLEKGERFEARLADGTLEAEIHSITPL